MNVCLFDLKKDFFYTTVGIRLIVHWSPLPGSLQHSECELQLGGQFLCGVPLSLFGVAGNYASALFIAASKANALQKVESEILDIVEASKNSPVFSQFIKDLSVPADTRVKAVQEIFSEAKFSDLTKNFLCILAENGRLRHVETIAKNFTDLTMAHRGEVKATVTTVIPLPAEEEKQLKEILGTIIGQGKTVKLEQKIDQSILGGIVIEFSQKVFDMSIKTRAKNMEAFLRVPINFNDLQ